MKKAVLERVKQVIKTKCNSVNDFASKIGMVQNTVNNQINGVRGISFDLILATLSAFPDVSAEWLLRGTEPMLIGEQTTNTFNVKGTDNSVEIHGDSQGDITTNGEKISGNDIILKLIEQNNKSMAQTQELINILAKK